MSRSQTERLGGTITASPLRPCTTSYLSCGVGRPMWSQRVGQGGPPSEQLQSHNRVPIRLVQRLGEGSHFMEVGTKARESNAA